MSKVRLFLGAAGAGWLGLTLPVAQASADVPPTVTSYSSTAVAAVVHVIGGSSAFPNFQPGAVDNRYPLAAVKQDSSPSSYATASFQDVGPLVQTLTPGAGPYAHAQTGGKADDSIDTCATGPAAFTGFNNFWTGNVTAGGGPANPLPATQPQAGPCQPIPGVNSKAHAEELSSSATSQYVDSGSYNISAGVVVVTGGLSHADTQVKPDGTLISVAHSVLKSVSIGPITINKVDTLSKVTSAGGKVTFSGGTTIGQVLVNGGPVPATQIAFGSDGVYVAGGSVTNTVPAPAVAGQQQDVYHVWLTTPEKHTSGSRGVMTADGVHVALTHPQAGGQPVQNVEFVVGESQVDASALPADTGAAGTTGAASSSTSGDSGVSADSSASSDFSPGGSGDISSSGDSTSPEPAASSGQAAAPVQPRLVMALRNKKGVALLFLLWETLLMAFAAAVVWTRRARREDELA